MCTHGKSGTKETLDKAKGRVPGKCEDTKLIRIMEEGGIMAEIAWEKLKMSNPVNFELVYIIGYVEQFRNEAWEVLKQKSPGPTDDELRVIACFVQSLREEAMSILNKRIEKRNQGIN